MNTTFTAPPILRGNEAQQLAQLRDYLVAMSKQLNIALTSLDAENFSTESPMYSVARGDVPEAIKSEEAALKDLIISTADKIEHDVETLQKTLSEQYVASGVFGAFREETETNLYVDATKVTWASQYNADLISALQNYNIYAEGYIKGGWVAFQEDGVTPVMGIAVGQNFKTYDFIYDGKTEQMITTENEFRAVFTAEKLSFYKGSVEVAYMSNNKLYIPTANIVNSLQIGTTANDGSKWEITHDNGFAIKWTGGA